VALVAAHVFDLIMIHLFARWQYSYKISRSVILFSVVQVGLGVLAFATTFIKEPLTYWVSGSVLLIISIVFSLNQIRRKV